MSLTEVRDGIPLRGLSLTEVRDGIPLWGLSLTEVRGGIPLRGLSLTGYPLRAGEKQRISWRQKFDGPA